MRPRGDITLSILSGLLVFSAFTSGLSIEAGSVLINLVHGVLLLLVGYLVLCAAGGKYRVPVVFKDNFSVFLYLFCATNILSSFAFADHRIQALKGSISLLGFVFVYTASRSVVSLAQEPFQAISRLTSFNFASASFGLICMAISFSMGGAPNIGVSLGHLSIGVVGLDIIPPSIKALAVEPNLFSIGTATVLCLTLGPYLLDHRSSRQLVTIIVLGLAILFAYTRSVYGALIITVAVLLLLSKRTRVLKTVIFYGGGLILIVVVFVMFLPEENPVRSALVQRFATLIDFKGGTGGGRLEGYRIAFEGLMNNPVFGNGTFSAETRVFNPYSGQYEERMGGAGWLTGSFIQALHDTGILGFLAIVAVFGFAIRSNYVLFKSLPTGDSDKSLALGFLGGNIILLVTSQLSSPMWTAFPYIFWGINMEFLSYSRQKKSTGEAPAVQTP